MLSSISKEYKKDDYIIPSKLLLNSAMEIEDTVTIVIYYFFSYGKGNITSKKIR